VEQGTRQLQPAATNPFAASLAPPNSTGSALYVINLCASMTPINHANKVIPGFENYRIYQVSRKEDGRIRYRLRLGFFTDEAEAETALACIREYYPTAFATSLCDEDQRHTRGFASKASDTSTSGLQPKVVAPSQNKPQTTATAAAKTAPTSTPQAAAVNPQANVAPQSPKPAAAPAAKTPASNMPAAPAKHASASDTQRVPPIKPEPPVEDAVEIEWTPPVKQPAATAASAAPAGSPASTSQPSTSAKAFTGSKLTAHETQARAGKTTTPSTATTANKLPAAQAKTSPPTVTTTELMLASDPPAPTRAAPAESGTNEPFHVGRGVDIPSVGLSLETDPVGSAATKSEAGSQASASTPDGKAATAQPTRTSTADLKRPVAPRAAKPQADIDVDEPLPDLDSTQTIRALTAEELDDETQPKWYAVQLAVSEQPINLETMPRLDIFAAYRLYSVATAGSGKILHHLRIGFFREEVSAEAVCGYLKTFFANPTVLRVSVAEHKRFSDAPPPKPLVESKAKVIELSASHGRTPAADIPVVTMEVTPSPAATGQFAKLNTGNTGVHKRVPDKAPPAKVSQATWNAQSKTKASATGKHRSLEEALLEEARQVELSESAIRRPPKNSSLLSKLFGKK
jgi:hypothetical protein